MALMPALFFRKKSGKKTAFLIDYEIIAPFSFFSKGFLEADLARIKNIFFIKNFLNALHNCNMAFAVLLLEILLFSVADTVLA